MLTGSILAAKVEFCNFKCNELAALLKGGVAPAK